MAATTQYQTTDGQTVIFGLCLTSGHDLGGYHEAGILPRQPQRQDSLSDQLRDLKAVAVRLSMYDAVVWLERRLET